MIAGLALMALVAAPQSAELLAQQAARSAAERSRLLLDAWVAADEARRASALRTLERLRPAGAAAAAPPAPLALARAWRGLTGHELEAPDPEQEALDILAEAIELTVVPGCFAVRAEGPGEPLTVHVSTLAEVRPAGEVELSLWWQPPAGTGESLRARRTTAYPSAFGREGFELYIRPPVCSQVSLWQLVAQVERNGRSSFGLPIEVECLRDPALLMELAPEDPPERSALAAEFAHCLTRGRSLTFGVSLAQLAGQVSDPGGRYQWVPAPAMADRQCWAWRPATPLRVVVILIATGREHPSLAFAGALGQRWRATASELGALLLPWSSGPGLVASFDGLTQQLDDLQPGAGALPRVLVTRGDAAAYLALALGDAAPPFDAWVLTWGASTRPRLPWPRLPARVLAAEAPDEPAALDDEGSARRTWQRGSGVVLLDEWLLPAQVADLLRELEREAEPRAR